MAKNTKPAIRFKGFTDAWEQRKLGEIATEVNRNDPESIAPIMMITANNGFIEQSERYAFNNAGESLKKYILLERGELAYNHGASKLRPYGSCFALTNTENARIPFVYHCFSVGENDSEFISIELNGSEIERQLRRIVSSGARMDGLLNISYEEYSTVELNLPSIEEQQAISGFFHILDHLITLHQRKYDSLVNVKKAMLEKMFPKNGETVPEIRFKGFTDAWEQRKLVNDLKSIQTGTNKLGSTENTGMPLLKMGNIQRGYFSLDKLEYLDENDVVEPENIAYKGDFFFNTRNTLDLVGKGATWTGDSGKYAFNSNIARFNLGELDAIFFNYLYNTGSMQKQVHARAMGTTSVAAIYPRTLDSITYCIPCKEEQLKIGYCLKNIDDLITLHQRKLEKLKNIKKSCLEKMFV